MGEEDSTVGELADENKVPTGTVKMSSNTRGIPLRDRRVRPGVWFLHVARPLGNKEVIDGQASTKSLPSYTSKNNYK